MRYDASLIQLPDSLLKNDSMYSLICLSAAQLNLTLSATRCFLDGKYLLCLSADDSLRVRNGYYEALQLRFVPYFYNVNLNHQVIGTWKLPLPSVAGAPPAKNGSSRSCGTLRISITIQIIRPYRS